MVPPNHPLVSYPGKGNFAHPGSSTGWELAGKPNVFIGLCPHKAPNDFVEPPSNWDHPPYGGPPMTRQLFSSQHGLGGKSNFF